MASLVILPPSFLPLQGRLLFCLRGRDTHAVSLPHGLNRISRLVKEYLISGLSLKRVLLLYTDSQDKRRQDARLMHTLLLSTPEVSGIDTKPCVILHLWQTFFFFFSNALSHNMKDQLFRHLLLLLSQKR